MKDIRISIRLTEKEHSLFKIIAIKKKKSMQMLLKEYVISEIERDCKNETKRKN